MMNKKIIITLEITDEETVIAYSKCDKSFISDDLLHGTLMSQCEITSINVVNDGN